MMSDTDLQDHAREPETTAGDGLDFIDQSIDCVDCTKRFTWTAGEQEFFRDKGLKHKPKRCRVCKKAKNERIESIMNADAAGKRKIEVSVICDVCASETTVPFYPSQGRPVLCRSCFLSQPKS